MADTWRRLGHIFNKVLILHVWCQHEFKATNKQLMGWEASAAAALFLFLSIISSQTGTELPGGQEVCVLLLDQWTRALVVLIFWGSSPLLGPVFFLQTGEFLCWFSPFLPLRWSTRERACGSAGSLLHFKPAGSCGTILTLKTAGVLAGHQPQPPQLSLRITLLLLLRTGGLAHLFQR